MKTSQDVRNAIFVAQIILIALFVLMAWMTAQVSPESGLVSGAGQAVILVLLVSAVSAIASIPNRKFKITDTPKFVAAAMAIGVNYFLLIQLPKSESEALFLIMGVAALVLFLGLLFMMLLTLINPSKSSSILQARLVKPGRSLWQRLNHF